MLQVMKFAVSPRRAALIVLALLFLRALVPAGFMLARVDGGLAVVLCEPDVLAPLGHQHAGHDHAAHHHGEHGAPGAPGGHDAHGDPSCPYAQSAGSALLPTLPLLAAGGPLHRLASPPEFTQTVLSFGPPRQPVSRGPPALV